MSPEVVATLERFAGRAFEIAAPVNWINTDGVSRFLNAAYGELRDWVHGQLAIQTYLAADMQLIVFVMDPGAQIVSRDYSDLMQSLIAQISQDHELGVAKATAVLRALSSSGAQVSQGEWDGFRQTLGLIDERLDFLLESRGLTKTRGTLAADTISPLATVLWTGAPIAQADFGDAGNDHITGFAADDVLFGGDGNDVLNDSEGNNVFDGGAGNDQIVGGTGSDTYIFRRGSGSDIILEASTVNVPTEVDRILMARDIAPQDARVWRDLSSLYIGIVGTADQVKIVGYFEDPAYFGYARVEQVQFSDGTIWNDVTFSAAKFLGTEAGESIMGNNNANVIVGLGGNDELIGSAGNDTYEFSPGFGVDRVIESEGALDTISFTGGVASSAIQLSRDAADLYLTQTFTGERVKVEGHFVDPAAKIERVLFEDGTIWDSATLDAAYYVGSNSSDTLQGTVASETFLGLGANDWIGAGGGDDSIDAGSGNDIAAGGDGNDLINGGLGDDQIAGEAGDDVLIGGAGADSLDGGDGNDVYRFTANDGLDLIVDNGGIDSIEFDATVSASSVGRYRNALDPGNFIFELTGGQAITVSGWFNSPSSEIESIVFAGGVTWGTTQLRDYRWLGSAGNDWISTADENVYVEARGGDDVLITTAGDDVLDGGTGSDWLYGGAGSDTYTYRLGDGQDTISDDAGLVDKVVFGPGILASSVYVSRDSNNLYLSRTGTSERVTIFNYFVDPSYVVERIEFDDGVFWDVSTVATKLSVPTSGSDFIWGTENVDSINGLAGNDTLLGNGGNDTLSGADGDDILDGGAGVDAMNGGVGNDIYVIDNLADVVTEGSGEGVDEIRSIVTWTLGANVENLTLLPAGGAVNGTGNASANVLTGNDSANALNGASGDDTLLGRDGNDTLNGGVGNDTMNGGLGNDNYVVDSANDVVTENVGEGTDTVSSSVTYTLSANVENLTLTGSAVINGTGNADNNVLTGNSVANVLSGAAGNDTLNGGAGADTMLGGLGNDAYTIDNVGDVVTENANEGTDTVSSSVTYTLSANVENLTLTGSTAINGTGNASNNVVTGNTGANVLTGGAGDDTLNGGTGADTMVGGLGNDAYTVDNVGDIVTELANEGTDTVSSSVTYSLSSNVENLTLTGSAVINGTGNTLENVLTGNTAANTLTGGAGNDTLNGGTGADTMVGGTGDDTYFVDNAADVVTELANEGTDTVNSSLAYTLGTTLENLTLTGTSAISGTGNAVDNVLTGNTGNNTLTGNAGNDTLNGGVGTDILAGGTGNDTYVLGRGYGADTIQEADATAGTTDVARFLTGIAADQLWFRQVANNLEVSVIGTTDKFTLQNWYLGNQNHVEQFKIVDGNKTLLDSQVQNLVNAMAAFTPPAAGQTTLPSNYATALNPVIAANWQ